MSGHAEIIKAMIDSHNTALSIMASAMHQERAYLNDRAPEPTSSNTIDREPLLQLIPIGDPQDEDGFEGFKIHVVDAECDPFTVRFNNGFGIFTIGAPGMKYVSLDRLIIEFILVAQRVANSLIDEIDFLLDPPDENEDDLGEDDDLNEGDSPKLH